MARTVRRRCCAQLDARTGAIRAAAARRDAVLVRAVGDGRSPARVRDQRRRDGETYEVDAETLRVLRRFPAGDEAGAVSRDGRLYALGSAGRRRAPARPAQRRRCGGSRAATRPRSCGSTFTPDGKTLVTSAEDGGSSSGTSSAARSANALRGTTRRSTASPSSADGRTLYSAASDGRTIVWDLAGDRRLARPFGTGAPFFVPDDEFPKGVALRPDGRSLAVTQSDGTVHFFDTRTLRRTHSLRALRGFAAAADFSPDGRLLAVTGEDGQITLWDARPPHASRGELNGLTATSQALAFSPDGKLLAAADLGEPGPGGRPGTVALWDVARRAPTGARFNLSSPSLAFSPDGRLLAAAGIESPTEVRDVAQRQARGAPADRRLRPLGRLLPRRPAARHRALRRPDAALVDRELEACGTRARGSQGARHLADVHPRQPDARHVGADGTVLLWDVATRQADRLAADRRSRRRSSRRCSHGTARGCSRSPTEGPGGALADLARGLEAARLPRRGPRADGAGVGATRFPSGPTGRSAPRG